MKRNTMFFVWCLLMVIFSYPTMAQKNILWFSEPGTKWEEAIPIGNGRLGAMVRGGIQQDIWSLNEETLWSGYPQDKQNYDAIKYLPQIRSLLNERKTKETEKLINAHMLGPWNESYQPVGDMIFDFDHKTEITGYRRELNLNKGVVEVSYHSGDVSYTRETFASFPDNVMVTRIYASKKGALNFSVSFNSQLPCKFSANGNDLIMEGRAQSRSICYPDTIKDHFQEGKSMRFQAQAHLVPTGGKIASENGKIIVKDADEVIIILAIQTSYNGFDKNPYTDGKDYKNLCSGDVGKAVKKGFNQLKKSHTDDYTKLFGRVDIDLGTDSAAQKPLQSRILNYQAGKDPNLSALYFQFGRYLLISASRPGTKASTLQGIWNKDLKPAWSSNYTLNCNVELNYWPANLANLAECHLPLIDLAKDLSVDGARTAKNVYGTRGWMAHHNADLWCTTSPVGGTGLWAIYQVGGAWLAHHLWEQYLQKVLDRHFKLALFPNPRAGRGTLK